MVELPWISMLVGFHNSRHPVLFRPAFWTSDQEQVAAARLFFSGNRRMER
jgi:hypothetical protein